MHIQNRTRRSHMLLLLIFDVRTKKKKKKKYNSLQVNSLFTKIFAFNCFRAINQSISNLLEGNEQWNWLFDVCLNFVIQSDRSTNNFICETLRLIWIVVFRAKSIVVFFVSERRFWIVIRIRLIPVIAEISKGIGSDCSE